MEARDRPVSVERVRSPNSIQDRFQAVGSQCHQRGDWMVSLDLKDAYLQIPAHPDSHQLLRVVLASPRLRRSVPGSWLLFR